MDSKQIVVSKGTKHLAKINNKDLLIVSLLDYICTIHGKEDGLFKTICEYLHQNGVIDDEKVLTYKSSKFRYICSKLINSFIGSGPKKLISQDDSSIKAVDQICQSRYKTDFIEIEKVGKGGYGTVFKAHNKLDGCLYAIKKIKITKLDEEKKAYYLDEVRYLSRMTHQNVVRYYTTWLEFDKSSTTVIPTLYIQMELCSMSLEEYIISRNYSGDSVDFEYEMDIFKQIVKGLKYIHNQNLIHGDLNPKNIFLDDNLNVKIGDFGLSKKCYHDGFVDASSYGNYMYMAPEQLKEKILFKKSDIYSLGIIFLELFMPFSTNMEKILVLDNLKARVLKPLDSLNSKLKNLFLIMFEQDYKKRADIQKINIFLKNIDGKL